MIYVMVNSSCLHLEVMATTSLCIFFKKCCSSFISFFFVQADGGVLLIKLKLSIEQTIVPERNLRPTA